MKAALNDLWDLVLGRQFIDAAELAEAVEDEAGRPAPDFRTRLLIRDSVQALSAHWGRERLERWLDHSPVRERIEAICREDLGKPGFPFLREQIMDATKPETIRQMFRELGGLLRRKVRVYVGGLGSLILSGHLSRRTQDIDIVDEVPPEIRALGEARENLEKRFRLQLGHFQSHYLPSGWQQRVHTLEAFGDLQVAIVDVYDVFMSKMFSSRDKDRDDLRELATKLDKETIIQRLTRDSAAMLAAEGLRQRAEKNWYIVYGESLPQ
jgi:hypothetical protein